MLGERSKHLHTALAWLQSYLSDADLQGLDD